MADNVVKYVMQLDSKNAEKGLDKVGKEAGEASQDLNKLSRSMDKAAQSTQKLGQQQSFATKQARNFRRAGRDLDGAFGDLAQGVGLLNKDLGNAFMDISAGASVVEGLGRSMVLFLNPAVATAAAVAITAGGAFYLLERNQKKLEEASKETEKAVAELNKSIEQQEKVTSSTEKSLIGYFETIQAAKDQLLLLNGQTTQYAIELKAASAASRDLKDAQFEQTSGQYEAINATIQSRIKATNLLREEIALLGDAEEAEAKKAQMATLDAANKADRQRLDDIQNQNVLIARQAYEYEQTLKKIAKVQQEERNRRAAQKRAAEARRKEQELERQFEKLYQEQEAKAKQAKQAELDEGARALKAQQELQSILIQQQNKQLTAAQQVKAATEEQIRQIYELANISGQRELAERAVAALRKNATEQMKEINQTELENLRTADEKLKKEQEITAEKAKQDKLDKQQGKADILAAAVSLDVAGIASMINPALGSIIGSLQTLGEKTPKQLREEAAAQAKALSNGLALLPTLLMEILPMLFVQLVEAIIDGVLRMLVNGVRMIVQGVKALFSLRDRDPDNSGQKRRRQAIKDYLNPFESASFAGGGRFIPSAAGGIRFTGAQDGLAMLHRGEFVVPQSGQRPQQVDRQMQTMGTGGVSININAAVVERNAVDALVRQIENRFNNRFGVSSSSLFGGR